jgi:hypothetical protein
MKPKVEQKAWWQSDNRTESERKRLCSGDYPYDNLARFGYRLDMKVEKKQNPSIFLATYWNLSEKIVYQVAKI